MNHILFLSIFTILNSYSQVNNETVLGNFKGKIGNDLNVMFHLDNNNDNNISGFYFYEKTGVDIRITGNIKENNLLVYELDFRKDTIAIIKGNIKDSVISGKWINYKTKKEYPLIIKKTNIEISPLPKHIEGKYYDKICNLTLLISKSKGEYYYDYKSSERNLHGKVSFSRGKDLYLNLKNIEYAEDYFDVSLAEEDMEKSKEYEELKKNGKRHVGVDCYFDSEEIIIQNYGNAMNYYVKLYDCGEKYIHLQKQ